MNACTFIGHQDCDRSIVPTLYAEIEKLILCENVSTFYVGNNGHFDYYVYQALCELEKSYDMEIIVVLAYLNYKHDAYYSCSKTMFPSVLEKTPLRFAISKRNLYMISNSKFLICYLNQTFTNTYSYVKKALRQKLTIINIGSYDLDKI